MSGPANFFALRVLDIAEATDLPDHGTPLTHYGFNEPGTWGFCPHCKFVVTVAEDGRMLSHERLTGAGGYNRQWCRGGLRIPLVYYRSELPEEGADDDPTPPGDDSPDAD